MIQVEKAEDHGLSLDVIQIDGGTQSRALLNQHVVDDYAEAIKAGAVFPLIVVFYDGKKHWLADGFHRFHAYQKAGRTNVPADVRQGTRRDAILHSVGANETHGLRRTRDDKRRAVLTLLNDSEWSAKPETWIAETCHVSRTLVRAVLTEQPHLVEKQDRSTVREVTRGGTTYAMQTAAIGKAGGDEKQEITSQTVAQQGSEGGAEAVSVEKEITSDDDRPVDARTDVEREADAMMLAWDKASPDARDKFIAYLRFVGFTITESNQATGTGGEDVDRSASRASSAVEVGATKSQIVPTSPRQVDVSGPFINSSLATREDGASVASHSAPVTPGVAEQTGAVPAIPTAPVAPVQALSKADQVRLLRPHCQHPGTDLCGGSGRNHCYTCKKLMAEGEAA